MSSFGPVSAGRSPVVLRPTTGAVSRPSCGFESLDYECLRASTRPTGSGALDNCCLAADALWVCRCGQIALAALPRGAGTLRARCYQGNLAPAFGLGCC